MPLPAPSATEGMFGRARCAGRGTDAPPVSGATACLWVAAVVFLTSLACRAQMMPLPIVLSDNNGINWDIQHDGSIGDGGNDLYDGGGRLFVNGQTIFRSMTGMAQFDAARNEVILGPMNLQNLVISRRVAVNARLGFCRWAEVIENPSPQKTRVQLRINFNMGGMVQFAQPLIDARSSGKTIGMVVGDQRHVVGVVGAGRASKVVPAFQTQQFGDNLDLTYDLEVPARQTVIVVHVQGYRFGPSAAMSFLTGTRENEYLAQLPPELRKLVVNFRTGGDSIGGLEILRGDAQDVIELRGGDQLRGDLLDTQYTIQTAFGPITIPASRAIAFFNAGAFRPRQLVVTTRGEIIGGQLSCQTVSMRLSTGQVLDVPIENISRAGYRRRPGESDQLKSDRPLAILRSGDRIEFNPPQTDLEVFTRLGSVRLRFSSIAAILFQQDQNPLHQVVLADGSRFSGLLLAGQMELPLSGYGDTVLRLPVAALSRLQLAIVSDEPDPGQATLSLEGDDLLVGTIQGRLDLQTLYDTIQIEGAQIQRLAPVPGSPLDVQIALWDNTLLQGRLACSRLDFLAAGGARFEIPVVLVLEYVQPRPQPSDRMILHIHELVRRLSAESWAQRQAAQDELTELGLIVVQPLRQLRPAQPLEGRQRIDLVLRAIERDDPSMGGATSLPPPPQFMLDQ